MLLLIFHAPDFWKWVCVPMAIFTIEILFRAFKILLQTQGKSVIKTGNVLPSK